MSKILILGDSFAADWSVKYKSYSGWPTLLTKKHDVTNIAQAGVSEYKIYKQLLAVKNLETFDWVIISHTSPYRVPTVKHPVHSKDSLHKDADLIFTDIEYHNNKLVNLFNRSLKAAYNFFLYHYDKEYYEVTYTLIRKEINHLLKDKKVLVVSNLDILDKFIKEDRVLNFCELFKKERGIINHFTEKGNNTILAAIEEELTT
jgi:hypothetical protein